MAFLDFLFGTAEKQQQVPRFTGQQQRALSGLLSGVQQQLPQGLDFLSQLLSGGGVSEETYDRPALRQFSEQIVPGIAERFTGEFGPGSQQSSAFGQQLGQAGAGLAEALAAQRSQRGVQQQQLGLQGLSQLQALLGAGLAPQYDTRFSPAQPGFLAQQAPGASQLGLLKLLGAF